MESLSNFHPAVEQWFSETFSAATPPQKAGWPSIAADQNTLILAPTGSGKTLAAFLWCINHLVERRLGFPNEPVSTEVLYISPLKALNNDIWKNLRAPLSGVRTAATRLNYDLPEIRAAVRTGDTPQSLRSRMVRQPPDILLTTPESLYLILTSARAREILRKVRYVIVDEIHAAAGNKRGTHLSLSLERLEELTETPPVRIGLSATQRPLTETAAFLGGLSYDEKRDGYSLRPVNIIDAGIRRETDLGIISPVSDFSAVEGGTVWPAVHDVLLNLIRTHGSTLIFANNRRLTERLAAALNESAGETVALVHHGSVSKEKRLNVERRLKSGELPAVVATGSLELGIDIGSIDLVCQVQSPGSVSVGLQRIGRAGHAFQAKGKGRLIALYREDLMEQTALLDEMEQGNVEFTHIPRNCLDVLAQQIAASVSVEDRSRSDLFRMTKRAYPFRELSEKSFNAVLNMLTGRMLPSHIRDAKPLINWDKRSDVLRARRGCRMIAVMNPGSIPDKGYYPVYLSDLKVKVGELEEEFVYERRVGEVFQLGASLWKIKRIDAERVVVEKDAAAEAQMPFWKGGFFSRSFDLGCRIGELRQKIERKISENEPVVEWLQSRYKMEKNAATALEKNIREIKHDLRIIPDHENLVIESFQDALGDHRLVLHAPFGNRIHAPFFFVLLSLLQSRAGQTVTGSYGNDGLIFRIPEQGYEDDLMDILSDLEPDSIDEKTAAQLKHSALFGSLFRAAAQRALLMPRRSFKKRRPLWLQRMQSKDFLAALQSTPDFPVVLETYRECLEDYFDLPNLKRIADKIRNNEIKIHIVCNRRPSALAASLQFNFTAQYFYDDDSLQAEKKAGLLSLDWNTLREILGSEKTARLLDPSIIQSVEDELQGLTAQTKARDADELSDLIYRLGDVISDEEESAVRKMCTEPPETWLKKLVKQDRITRFDISGNDKPYRWISAERLPLYRKAFGYEPSDALKMEQRESLKLIFDIYTATHGPFTVHDVIQRYGFEKNEIREIIKDQVNAGLLIEGRFKSDVNQTQWCRYDILQTIHRRSLERLKTEMEPVDPARLQNFLLKKHQIIKHDEQKPVQHQQKLKETLHQLAGLHLPWFLWQNEIFPARIPGYRREMLDSVLSEGEFVWTGMTNAEPLRILFYPIELFPGWEPIQSDEKVSVSSEETPARPEDSRQKDAEIQHEQLVYDYLELRGASFYREITQETGLHGDILLDALKRLLSKSRITNDRFSSLNVLMSSRNAEINSAASPAFQQKSASIRRKLRKKMHHRTAMPPGRWSALPQYPEVRGKNDYEKFIISIALLNFGIIARNIIEKMGYAAYWDKIFNILSQMELVGEIERGYFVNRMPGIQFMMTEDLRRLRDMRNVQESYFILNAWDPALLQGRVFPFAEELFEKVNFTRLPHNYVILDRGYPAAYAENKGKRIYLSKKYSRNEITGVFKILKRLADRPVHSRITDKIEIAEINQTPVLKSEYVELLKQAGFHSEYPFMVYRGYL